MNWPDSEKMDSDSEAVQTLCEKAVGAKFESDKHYSDSDPFQSHFRLIPSKTGV